jgi:hypothetical protein
MAKQDLARHDSRARAATALASRTHRGRSAAATPTRPTWTTRRSRSGSAS